jgi:transcription elongation factor GreB
VSRAFTKEERDEVPFVVPRPPLPDGVPNYVTARGLALLHAERVALEAARPDPEAPNGAAELAAHHARLGALEARIASAQPLDPASLPHDEVRFSAVTLRGPSGQERRFRIVGVDEADAPAGRIAFTAPLARELIGARVGDSVRLRSAQGELEHEIVSIDYSPESLESAGLWSKQPALD